MNIKCAEFLLFKVIYENTVKSFSNSLKEFDISKQKGESYPDYPDRESRRTGAHLPSR